MKDKKVLMAKASPRKKKTLFVVLQQGGSTQEFYATAYNTSRQAEKGIEGHEKASYQAAGPYEFPMPATAELEQQMIDSLEALAEAVVVM